MTDRPADDAPDLQRLLRRLEEADAAGGAAALADPAPGAEPGAEPVDDSADADADAVPGTDEPPLEGDFDSVDEVLEGVFDDVAAVVGPGAEGAVPSAGAAAPEDDPDADTDDPSAMDDVLEALGVPHLDREDDRPAAARPSPSAAAPAVAWMHLEPRLRGALALLNLPLRGLPDWSRVAVDWLAVTLVFWATVVWVVVAVF